MARKRNKRGKQGYRNSDKSQTTGGWSNKESSGQQSSGYASITKENADFEKFYKAQKIVPEEEWDKFMATLRENLPTTFRITGFKTQAKALQKIIESNYLSKLMNQKSENEDSGLQVECLPWYPDKLAWVLNLTRTEIRKTESYERLHNFLISETASGNICRQEAVSMIPPLLLDVQPHHKVLDMCASPGSKTAQLLEMTHADDKIIPEGMVLANDVDNKRCYMLQSNMKRLQSPCLLITNHDAGAMPSILLANGKQLKYDRILCDAPCSGDGTLRKNIDIWVKWNVANCLNFHGLQARILKRGLELLEVGGKLVYSTCSLCPIEDESVVHHVLAESKAGSVELVDVSGRLPGLKYVPGLTCWKVMNRELEEIATPADIPERNKNQIKPYMFPPDPKEATKFNLHRCVRILPHLQNTGGFFVAVFQKNSDILWETSKSNQSDALIETERNPNATDTTFSERTKKEPPKKKQRMMGHREDPFFYFNKDEKIWPSIQAVYDIDPSFDQTLLMTRCQEGKKRILYFTSKIIKEIVTCNESKVKIINTGIKLFCRCDKKANSTEFRLTQEGLLTIMPYLRKRVITVSKADVIYLLSCNFPELKQMSEKAVEQLKDYDTGSLAMSCESQDLDCYIALCAWKGAASLRAYVPKNEKIHYLRLCGVDTSKFERKKFQVDGAARVDISKDDADDDSVPDDKDDDAEITGSTEAPQETDA